MRVVFMYRLLLWQFVLHSIFPHGIAATFISGLLLLLDRTLAGTTKSMVHSTHKSWHSIWLLSHWSPAWLFRSTEVLLHVYGSVRYLLRWTRFVTKSLNDSNLVQSPSVKPRDLFFNCDQCDVLSLIYGPSIHFSVITKWK